jgi:hypothetical protein
MHQILKKKITSAPNFQKVSISLGIDHEYHLHAAKEPRHQEQQKIGVAMSLINFKMQITLFSFY